MTYTRETTHILTTDPKLVEAKLKRLRSQGWIIQSVTPGDGRTILISDIPTGRQKARRCATCGDTGYVDHSDGWGEYESHSYCECSAGEDAHQRDSDELEVINAEEAAVARSWMQPEPVPVYAGDDDLMAQPF